MIARDDALVKPSARPNVLLGAANAVFPFMQLPYRPVGNEIHAGIQVTMLTVGHKVFVMLDVTHHVHVVPVRHSLNDDLSWRRVEYFLALYGYGLNWHGRFFN